MAGERDLVLRLAGDAPRRRGEGLVLAHRQAGARLARCVGAAGARSPGRIRGERRELRAGGLGAGQVQQDAAQPVAHGDRRVGRGVDAAGDRRTRSGRAGSCWRARRRPRGRWRTPAGRRRRASAGDRAEPSTASRVRLKSLECLSTAPAATSPIRSPCSPKRATSPSRAAVSMSWLLARTYVPPARANGMRLPPTTTARRACRRDGRGGAWWTRGARSLRSLGRASRAGGRSSRRRAQARAAARFAPGGVWDSTVPDTVGLVSRITRPS